MNLENELYNITVISEQASQFNLQDFTRTAVLVNYKDIAVRNKPALIINKGEDYSDLGDNAKAVLDVAFRQVLVSDDTNSVLLGGIREIIPDTSTLNIMQDGVLLANIIIQSSTALIINNNTKFYLTLGDLIKDLSYGAQGEETPINITSFKDTLIAPKSSIVATISDIGLDLTKPLIYSPLDTPIFNNVLDYSVVFDTPIDINSSADSNKILSINFGNITVFGGETISLEVPVDQDDASGLQCLDSASNVFLAITLITGMQNDIAVDLTYTAELGVVTNTTTFTANAVVLKQYGTNSKKTNFFKKEIEEIKAKNKNFKLIEKNSAGLRQVRAGSGLTTSYYIQESLNDIEKEFKGAYTLFSTEFQMTQEDIEIAINWAVANNRIFHYLSYELQSNYPTAIEIADTLKTKNLGDNFILTTHNEQYLNIAYNCNLAKKQPGSINSSRNVLIQGFISREVKDITDSATLISKNINFYYKQNDIYSFISKGKMFKGFYIDNFYFNIYILYTLANNIEAFFTDNANNGRTTRFTQSGLASISGLINSAIQPFVNAGTMYPNPEITIPSLEEIGTTNILKRTLSLITIKTKFIHFVDKLDLEVRVS